MSKKTPAEVKEKATPVEEKVYIGTKQLAEKLGVASTTLRRWLRTLPSFQDGGYTRYKWDPSDPKDAQFLKDAEESFKKFQTSAEDKAKAREADAKEKAEKKAAAKAAKPKGGKKNEEPEPDVEEDEDDDNGEDSEEELE